MLVLLADKAMLTQIIRHELGIIMTVVLTVGFQDFVRVPNDRTGVGASGKIGRGTSPGEQFVPRSRPTQTSPAWVYSTPSMPAQAPPVWVDSTPAQASPAQGTVTPSESADRAETRGMDLAVRLPAVARGNPYLAYHRTWFNSYWTARLTRSWSRSTPAYAGTEAASWKGPIVGLGLGWSLPAWLIGPMAYRWGYFPYDNPFDRGGPSRAGERPRVDDYSRPIRILNTPPTEALLNDALMSFRAARAAFRDDDFPRARDLTDEALRLMPDDPMLHQFRALVLFALRRYDEAAAAIYAVLAVGPGWDWKTMIDLYGDRGTYTRQLRLLEVYSDDNPRAAAARFLRAYHYFTTGYVEEALGQWNRVVELRPNDRLSLQLILELQPSQQGTEDRDALAQTGSGAPGKLEGTWIALPRPDTTIAVTFQPRGHIVWKVRQPGRDRGIEGYAIHEKKTLILSEDQDNILVGRIHWQDNGHFTFKALADRPGEPGLTFAKAP
jgi:tetratricopeptide (TPR) repeat protein